MYTGVRTFPRCFHPLRALPVSTWFYRHKGVPEAHRGLRMASAKKDRHSTKRGTKNAERDAARRRLKKPASPRTSEEAGLAYGALFGPDVADAADRQGIATRATDRSHPSVEPPKETDPSASRSAGGEVAVYTEKGIVGMLRTHGGAAQITCRKCGCTLGNNQSTN